MTPEELSQIQAQLDQQLISEMRYELNRRLRQHIVDWAQTVSDKFMMAAMSAASGRWEDVLKDIERGRISQAQALNLLEEFKKCRLMNITAYDWRKQQVEHASNITNVD